MKRTVILASASPRRRELLRQIGIEPEIIPSRIEEIITTDNPEKAVLELSRQKAMDVAAGLGRDAWVIGADTVVAAQGKILGKPCSVEEAVEMISMLQGAVHQVYTGVTLILCGPLGEIWAVRSFAEQTDVTVFEMDQEEIIQYARSEEPMDKAGAYGIQGLFAAYIEGISGDYNNVVGLPVGRVCQEIKQMEREVDFK